MLLQVKWRLLSRKKDEPEEGTFAALQHQIMNFLHSDRVTYFLILCLILDVILTLGEFVIAHQQCDYKHRHVLIEKVGHMITSTRVLAAVSDSNPNAVGSPPCV